MDLNHEAARVHAANAKWWTDGMFRDASDDDENLHVEDEVY